MARYKNTISNKTWKGIEAQKMVKAGPNRNLYWTLGVKMLSLKKGKRERRDCFDNVIGLELFLL